LKSLRFDLKNSKIASNRNNSHSFISRSHSLLPKQEQRDYIIYAANKPTGTGTRPAHR